MDNIIQIIVFLFIIYSILAPLFGKKKPQKNSKQVPENYGGDVRKTRTSSKPTTQDILEDFLGFKIPKTGDEYENYSRKTELDYVSPKTENFDTDLKINYRDLEAESKLLNSEYDKYPTLESVPMGTSLTTKVLDAAFPFSDRTLLIKKYLYNKNELRSAFLFSEIINKPKALRR